MTHANAPLTPAGRLRLVQRCQARPIAHVAAEAGVSRSCLSKWKNRYDRLGEAGLHDRASVPHASPTQTPAKVVERIEELRREHKWSATRIALELAAEGHRVSTRTVGRWPECLGINKGHYLDPEGSANRRPGRITARYPGHMLHLDVKKVGRIPDGGGWRAHGRGSEQDKAAQRAKARGTRAGYVYMHSAVDGFSRLAYTEHLSDEKAATTIGFFCRARAFFAAHGINRIVRVVTDNGANYRARDFGRTVGSFDTRHQRTRPYTPRHNGKVERYQRILAEEFIYARTWTSEAERANALQIWNLHYNYHRPHTAVGNQPPVTRLTNLSGQYN
jgi:transposase InsO family protein